MIEKGQQLTLNAKVGFSVTKRHNPTVKKRCLNDRIKGQSHD